LAGFLFLKETRRGPPRPATRARNGPGSQASPFRGSKCQKIASSSSSSSGASFAAATQFEHLRYPIMRSQ